MACTTENSTMTSPASDVHISPRLPNEIWAHVISYVNDFDLWVTCRQISRTFRAEAEREFARERLCRLYIAYDIDYKGNGGNYFFTARILRLRGIDDANVRAHFDFKFRDVHRACIDPANLDENQKQKIQELLQIRGVDFDKVGYLCRGETLACNQRAKLQDMVARVEMPDLKIDFGSPRASAEGHAWPVYEASFDWKAFLTRFFDDEVRIRTLRHKHPELYGPCPWEQIQYADRKDLASTTHEAIERCKEKLTSKSEYDLHEQVYIQKLTAAFSKANKTLDLNSDIAYKSASWRWFVEEGGERVKTGKWIRKIAEEDVEMKAKHRAGKLRRRTRW